MDRTITVRFQPDNRSKELQLGIFTFVAKESGEFAVFGVGDVDVALPSGTIVTLTARWSPHNNMSSIQVRREGKVIGHAGSCWECGDPYLGLRLEGLGFLHCDYGRSPQA